MNIPILTETDIEHIVQSNKRVYAWGVSALSPLLFERVSAKICGFIDGLKSTTDITCEFGLPVYPPSVLIGQEDSVVIIIFADIQLFGQQIAEQIKGLGSIPFFQPPHPTVAIAQFRLKTVKALSCVNDARTRLIDTNKVCLCVPNLARGGAERQMLYLAKGLLALQHDVVLIVWKNGSNPVWLEEFEALGGKVEHVPPPRTSVIQQESHYKSELAGYLSEFFMPFEVYLIIQIHLILKRELPGHFLSYMDQPNVFGGIAAHAAGIPNCVMSARSANPDICFSLPNYLTEKHIANLYRLLLQSNRFVLTANAAQSARNYAKWIGEEVDVIPVVKNAVAIDGSKRSTAEIRTRHCIPNDALLIAGAMRFSPPKNPQRFVNIVAEFMTHNPTAWAIMMGDGKLMPDVKRLIEEKGLKQRIVLTGEVDNVAQHLFESDVFIQSSDMEGYPNALVEAIACECCVIATNVGGTREAIPENYPYNPLFAPEDEGIAVQLLETIANRKNKLLPSIVDLRHQVERNNSITSLAQKTLLASKYK